MCRCVPWVFGLEWWWGLVVWDNLVNSMQLDLALLPNTPGCCVVHVITHYCTSGVRHLFRNMAWVEEDTGGNNMLG